ncbi:MAG: sensor histidine kinase [Oceanicaulis sp.]
MAVMTARGAPDVNDFRKKFIGRLQALGIAHDLLLQSQWRYAGLSDVVSRSLAAYGEAGAGRIIVEGEDVTLAPKQGLGLAMVLHELATNAAKYGALSSRAGQLSVRWTVRKKVKNEIIALDWIESGGPKVARPGRTGFGATLVQRVTAQDLGGEVSVDYAETGVTARLEFPKFTIGDPLLSGAD